MNYGEAIKKLRKEKVFENQVDFSKNIGITQSYLSSIENGNKKPSTDLLETIAEYVKVPMPVLFWNSVTEKDVPEDKRESFNRLKSGIDSLIMSFF